MREREFARLDVPAASAIGPDHGSGVARRREARRRVLFDRGRRGRCRGQALLHRPALPPHPWLVAGGRPVDRRRRAARSGEPGGRPLGPPAGAVLGRAQRHGLQHRPGPPGRCAGHRPDARQRRIGDAAVALPGNMWANGEFADRIDPVTYTFTPLGHIFAQAMAAPKPQEYVSPDGSLVLPAFRVWNQGPDDHRGWRWSDALDAYGLVTARPGERVFADQRLREPQLQRAGRRQRQRDRPARGRRPRRRKRGARRQRQPLRRQRAGVRLRARRQAGAPHRRAGAPAAAGVRRSRPAHAVHPHPPRAVCDSDRLNGRPGPQDGAEQVGVSRTVLGNDVSRRGFDWRWTIL